MRLAGFARDRVLGWRAEVLAWRLLFGLGSLRLGVEPYGASADVIGVGIHAEACEVIVVLAPAALVGANQLLPLGAVPAIAAVVASVSLPGESWDDVKIGGVAPPVQHAGAGDLLVAAMNGTAGAPVHWTAAGATAHGILTAGHVAGAVAAPVATPRRVPVGAVADCALPAFAGVDAAVVALTARATSAALAAGTVTGRQNIELLTLPGKKCGVIIAKTGWLYWSSYGVTYIDLYVTSSVISVGGDSGSAAVVVGTNDFVGTLVGASIGSLIQDGSTQLGALSALAGLAL